MLALKQLRISSLSCPNKDKCENLLKIINPIKSNIYGQLIGVLEGTEGAAHVLYFDCYFTDLIPFPKMVSANLFIQVMS